MQYKFVLAAAVLLTSSGAVAQYPYIPYVPPYNPGFHLLNDSIKGNPKSSSKKSSNKQSTNVSEASTSAVLSYAPSKARRQQNFANFISKARSVDPATAAQMEQFFASTDLIGQIDQLMRQFGLRADNVADAYTVWWVESWQAANNKSVADNRGMYQAVKRQVSDALLATPGFTTATDAEKQEFAESLLIQAAMIDGHAENAKGNPEYQANLAKTANQGAMAMGLDLTKMNLTVNGFEEGSGGRSDASDADPTAAETDMAVNDNAGESDTGKLVLYGVGGVALLAGMFALGKSFGGKG